MRRSIRMNVVVCERHARTYPINHPVSPVWPWLLRRRRAVACPHLAVPGEGVHLKAHVEEAGPEAEWVLLLSLRQRATARPDEEQEGEVEPPTHPAESRERRAVKALPNQRAYLWLGVEWRWSKSVSTAFRFQGQQYLLRACSAAPSQPHTASSKFKSACGKKDQELGYLWGRAEWIRMAN